jgi:YidC/Oxa1 family membrane protein insertase
MIENNNQQPKFFDAKTLFAIVLIGLFYMGWQRYLTQKYPHMNDKKAEQSTALSTGGSSQNPAATTAAHDANPAVSTTPAETIAPAQVEKFSYENDKVKFQVSSEGMAVLNYESKNYYDRQNKPIALTSENKPVLAFTWGPENKIVNFKVTQDKEAFKGIATVGDVTIERTLTYHPESYSFNQEIKITNPQNKANQFNLVSQSDITQAGSKSFLSSSYEFQDLFTLSGGHKEHVNVSRSSDNLKNEYKTVNLYSLGTQYFTTGVLDESDVLPDLKFTTDVSAKNVIHTLMYAVPTTAQALYKQAIFMGPKSSDNLKAANENFVELVDYGFFGAISKPMLVIMKWFYGLVGNWGFAIVLLTLLVRSIVLPFNLMSFKSMKGMQLIQPQLAELRARYKDDPMTLNREMMAVMKQNNANPLSGCLPMLVQIPIFFALYRVIGSSVELYQAPFFGWIQDLSFHDKFYILPVLMGITMYIQQKLTPSTMDPTQAKIMALMPVVFSVFMLNLPAGLTLYMFVSAVFGIAQQKTFLSLMKKK